MSGTKRTRLELSYDTIQANIERRLFIGHVPPTANEADLQNLFSQFGTLVECRVIPGKLCGFVSYQTWAACHYALLAIDGKAHMPGHESQGRGTLTVSFADKSRSGKGGGGPDMGGIYAKGLGDARVFVGGLPEDYRDDDLRALFSQYGTVEGANLLATKGGKRCGFINYAVWGEALDAIDNLDGRPMTAGTEPITVCLAEPSDKNKGGFRAEPDAKRQRTNGGGFQVQQSVVPYTAPLGQSAATSYAQLKRQYVEALDTSLPSDALDRLHAQLMQQRSMMGFGAPSYAGGFSQSYPQIAATPPPRMTPAGAPPGAIGGAVGSYASPLPVLAPAPPMTAGAGVGGAPADGDRDSARLFVGGLPFECTDMELKALVDQVQFQSAGSHLLECRALPGRGCGYIRFGSWAAAEEAMEVLNDRRVDGWSQTLRVKWATPKSGAKEPPATEGNKQKLLAEEEVLNQGLDPKRLFIGQVAREIQSQESIQQLFEPYGRMEEVRLMADKGVCYISFSSFEESRNAMHALNGQVVPGVSNAGGLNIQYSRAR